MAYWQNGKLFLHASAQSTAHVSQSIGNWSKADRKNVVLLGEYVGGGFGGKNPETHMHTAIPGDAGQEDRAAGDDADHARGGPFHRPRARRDGHARPHGFSQRRPHRRAGYVRGAGQRPVCPRRRLRNLRGGGVGQLHAAEHALPRNGGADQYASARPTARPRRHAIDGNVRAADVPGRPQAGNRRGGDPQDQRAVHRLGLRRPGEGRNAQRIDQRVREGSAGARRRKIQLDRAAEA